MKQREKGDNHVLNVYKEIKKSLDGSRTTQSSESITNKTVSKLLNLYPNILSIKNKFQNEYPDSQPDLVLTLDNQDRKAINLFLIKDRAPIQPKNMGAKSFLNKYFTLKESQILFNNYFEERYEQYLNEFAEEVLTVPVENVKKEIRNKYPKFTEEIEKFRVSFLFDIREECFELFKAKLNNEKERFYRAISSLLLLDSINIITRYTKENKCSGVEEFIFDLPSDEKISIYKKGNYSIGIRVGNNALLIRFKFESGPASSVKLVSSYERFPEDNEVLSANNKDLKEFEILLANHNYIKTSNNSNAIGKCNEAMIYYRILSDHPYIFQVDTQEFKGMLEKYYNFVEGEVIKKIREASEISANKLYLYLQKKYNLFSIEEIQLVPDSYISNRLDTTDLLLTIKTNDEIIQEHISLKAINSKKGRITVKNAGIGQILGSQYFDVGTLDLIVSDMKNKYKNNLIELKSSLSVVSTELGQQLKSASQYNLVKGLKAIMGESVLLVTSYGYNCGKVIEHDEVIKGIVQVSPATPTPPQTKLEWNNYHESLFIRVKFSGRQSKGWSSMKVACEYGIRVDD